MSEVIEIEKTLKIDIQIDCIKCEDCSEELEFSVSADGFGDLQITVERCTCCDICAGE